MDVLGATTTVVSLTETSWKVITYIKDVKGAGEARQKLILELIRATGLLSTLTDIVKDVGDEEWSRALQSLNGSNGPLNDFKAVLEEIMDGTDMESEPAQALSIRDPGAAVPVSVGLKMRNKINRAIKDLKWPFTESTTQDLLSKLERIKTYLLLALSSDNVRLSKLIQTELQMVHREMSSVKDNTAAILEHQKGAKELTKEQKLMIQSICTIDLSLSTPSEELEQLKGGAYWLLSHSDFRHWHTGNFKGTLLLKGRAGSGKTSISSVVEYFLRASGTSSEVFVVGIYFDWRNQPSTYTLQDTLAFMVKRMLEIRPQFQKYYNKLMLTGEDPLSVEDSLRIIHQARQDFQHFYVVLDALDECTQQLACEVIERLARLHSPLSMFVTMREIPLVTHFSNVVEILISQQTISDHIYQIGSLAPSIHQIYLYHLQSLTNQEEADAMLGKRVLREILSADHPMSTEELLDAVASDADWEPGDRAHVTERMERCVKCCMSFVCCVKDGTVRIVHLSAEEFLRGPYGAPVWRQA